MSSKWLCLLALCLLPLTSAVANSPQQPPALMSANSVLQPAGLPDKTRFFIQPPLAEHHQKTLIRLEKSVRIAMADGVKLSTDFYFPDGVKGPFPTILMRTPYNKKVFRKSGSIAHYFAAQGYAVAVQDVRGKYESEGDYRISAADPEDGYAVLSWIAKQPWSSGKIGTYGCSYLGENQIQLAAQRHPNHSAAIAQAAGGAYGGTHRQFMYREGGVPELANSLGWFWGAGSKLRSQLPASLSDHDFSIMAEWFEFEAAKPKLDLEQAVWFLPVIDALKKQGNPLPTDYVDYLSSPPASPYWDSLNYVHDGDRFNVPTLHINSWYDGSANETLHLFNLLRSNSDSKKAADNQFVIMSPTGHCGSEQAGQSFVAGQRPMGDASLPYLQIYSQWFDHWLKNKTSNILTRPKVQYYLMGKNEWRSANSWPIPTIDYQRFYLHSAGHANSRNGDGRLSTVPPQQQPADHYIYDPSNPVPSVNVTGGAFDQSEVEGRKDVLVYTTEPLQQGLEVVGPLALVLFVSSSAKDTDFTAKLIDVHPDGRAYNLQQAILRARYREGFDQPVWMQAGEVYPLTLSLHATANYFQPGHRIRLEISSSNFPRYVRNLNTGGNNYDETSGVITTNSIHHNSAWPSHLILPLVRQPSAAAKPHRQVNQESHSAQRK